MREITPNWTTTGPLVVALVYDRLCTFEFSIVAEIYGLDRPELGPGWYRFAAAAVDDGPMRAHGGLRVVCDGTVELIDQAEIVVVPGWKGAGAPVPPALCERLRAAFRRGARLASICSGVFVLAAAGLLDGRRATTHWRYAERLARSHPSVEVDANVLYIDDDRILTSAGSAAGIDLMLHLIRSDFGVDAANSVARRLVVQPHRGGGQAQFIERPVPPAHGSRVSALIDAVRADPARDWPVSTLAREAAMSPRTFLRRFVEATGMPPAEWVAMVRVEEAKRLLETTELGVGGVATLAGFGTVAALRYHFLAKVGVTPSAYRASFA